MYIRSKILNCAINADKVKEIITSVSRNNNDAEFSWSIVFDNEIEWHYKSNDEMMSDFECLMSQLDCRVNDGKKQKEPMPPPEPINRPSSY